MLDSLWLLWQNLSDSVIKCYEMGYYFHQDINKLDSKKRVCLPSQLRISLPESHKDKVFSYRDPLEKRILLFDELFINNLMQKLIEDDFSDLEEIKIETVIEASNLAQLKSKRTEEREKNYSEVSKGFLTKLSIMKIDDSGRISLSDKIMKHANLEVDVMFCGFGSSIALYRPDIFESKYENNNDEQLLARKVASKLVGGLPS